MTTQVGTTSRLARSAWLLYLLVQAPLVALLAIVPRDGLWAAGLILSTWLAVGAIAAGIRFHRPIPARPWWILLTGLALYGVGNSIYYPAFVALTDPLPFPSVADVFFLVGYAVIVAGIASLAVSRRAFQRPGDVIDALVIAAGTATLSFTLLIAPYLDPEAALDAAQKIVAIADPVADLALLGTAGWVVLAGARLSPALLLGGAYIAVQLAADWIHGLGLLEGSYGPSSPALVLWPLSLVAVGGAALHPSMPRLTRPDGTPGTLGRRRFAVLALAALIGPVVTLANSLGSDRHTATLAALSFVLIGLVIARLYLLAVDVETHRRVLAELEAANMRTEALVQTSGAITWADRIVPGAGADTVAESVSSQALAITGYPAEEFIAGRIHWYDIVHKDDVTGWRGRYGAWIEAAEAHGRADPETLAHRYRIIRRDGHVRWVRDMVRLVLDERGVPARVTGVVVDVTDEVEAEDLIRASDARYRTLVEQLPAAVFLNEVAAGGTTRPLYVSPRSTEVLGWTPEEFLSDPAAWREIIHADDLATVAEQRAGHVATGEPRQVEARVARRDALAGGERWIDLRWVKVGDLEDGRWLSQGVALDITARRQAEDTLRRLNDELEARVATRAAELSETRALLEDVLALTPGLVLAGRYDTAEVTYVSGYAETLLGLAPADLPRAFDGWSDLLHPDDRPIVDAAVGSALASHAPSATYEVRYRRADGTYRWALVIQAYRYADDGAPERFVGIAIDIDDRKAGEAALAAARAEAERASRAKSEFLSSMSHELRTPLNAILGFGQLLEMSPLADADRESAVEIVRAGRNLLAMIEDVLEFSRLDAGRISLSIEPVELGPLVRETVDLARPAAEERGVTIVDLVPADAPIVVLADRRRLGQVILNLLSNASKYNRAAGSITLTALTSNGRARIVVADTGIGIEPERLARIFEPLEARAGERTARRSLGLGLALSFRLTTMMGGALTVTSEPGVGSTFTVELPLVTGAALPDASLDAASAGARKARGVADGSAAATILYIEDNLANLHLVERVLTSRRAVRMLAAMQGRLGLELAREHRPALVLLDLDLPDVEPEETLRELKSDERTRDIPVVILSSASSGARARAMIELGALDFVPKPFDMARLLALVDGVLERR